MEPLVIPPSLLEARSSWRPCEVEEGQNVPFAPSVRAEKGYRACDFTFWTAQKVAQREGRGSVTAVGDPQNDFTLVDSSKIVKAKSRYQKGRPRQMPGQQQKFQQQQQQRQQQQRQQQQKRPVYTRGGKKDRLSAAYQQNRNQMQTSRWTNLRARALAAECPVEIAPEWTPVRDIPLASLAPLSVSPKEIQIADVKFTGQLMSYNTQFDRVSPKQPKPINEECAQAYAIGAPRAQSDVELATLLEEREDVRVIITDQGLTALMSAPQSKYAWQLNCFRIEGNLIIDKADESNLDLLSVDETSPEPMPMETGSKARSVYDIGTAAARTNLALRLMTVEDQPTVEDYGELAFVDDEPVAPGRAYRYRTVVLPPTRPGTEPVTLAVRCQIDATAVDKDGDPVNVAVHALNESPVTRVPWTEALEKQKGALLATELRNNACKVTRWVYAAMMAGCSQLKLGWITRRNDKHLLLAVQTHEVVELSRQMGLKAANAWGVVREILDILLTDMTEDGQYILTRDALTPQLKLHCKPLPQPDL